MNKKMRMNLQLFADGRNDTGTDVNDIGTPETVTMPTFDDFLKGEGNQAEFDRRVNKAVQTAVGKAKEKWQALTDDKVSEADKLARMTKDEKAEYMQQKRERELSEREQAITKRELAAEAKNTLAEKKLPGVLADILDYSSADACKESIEKIEKAVNSAVAILVDEKLKGTEPPKKAPEGVPEKDFKDMTYAEKLKLKTENPALYKQLAGK